MKLYPLRMIYEIFGLERLLRISRNFAARKRVSKQNMILKNLH